MPRPIPIFRHRDQTFRADACEPLVQAVARGEIQLEALVHGHYPGRQLPRRALAGLKTIGYWNAPAAQSWGLPWHRNEGLELTFLESGRCGFAVEDCTYKLQPNALTITRPWQQHCVGDPLVGPGKLHWLILDVDVRRPNQKWKWPEWIFLSPADLKELADIFRKTNQPVWKASREIHRCFHEIGVAVESDVKGSSISILVVRINELLLLLLRLLRSQRPSLNESLTTSSRTVGLFLDNLAKNPQRLALEWEVHEMAESCGLGVTQFVQIAKRLTNMPPVHYLNHCRLDLAAKLLVEHPTEPITNLAHACGFSSSQYFATVFGIRFGCAPTRFRILQSAGQKERGSPC